MADSVIPQEKEAYAYSKAQTDALIAQSTATITGSVQSHASAGHGNMSGANFKVSQSGKVVSIQGALTGLGPINVPDDTYNRQWIGTISGVSMPPIHIRTTCTIANYAYEVGTTCYCAISTDGKITVTPPASVATGKAVYMSIVYVAE